MLTKISQHDWVEANEVLGVSIVPDAIYPRIKTWVVFQLQNRQMKILKTDDLDVDEVIRKINDAKAGLVKADDSSSDKTQEEIRQEVKKKYPYGYVVVHDRHSEANEPWVRWKIYFGHPKNLEYNLGPNAQVFALWEVEEE